MRRWIVIVFVTAAILVLFHFLTTREKTGGVGKLRKCSDVMTFLPYEPVQRNDQPVTGQVYVVPDDKKCK